MHLVDYHLSRMKFSALISSVTRITENKDIAVVYYLSKMDWSIPYYFPFVYSVVTSWLVLELSQPCQPKELPSANSNTNSTMVNSNI